MSKKDKNEPKVPQIYDVMEAVEKMDNLEKGTPARESAKNRANRELSIYNEFYGKIGHGTKISKVRQIIQFRNKRIKEDNKRKKLEREFNQARKSRDYSDNKDKGKRKI